ncbi:MAG TPA: 2-hydroxychromene-2-carboxylate isomerase [Solirubrobacteraceae bacterium]|nr:2-hydroxychromene-2-carboxylate isomerase [Solirubrobacteraceae bacterium]
MRQVTFYYDLGSPFAYLAAERIPTLIPEPIRWQPVLLGGLFKLAGRSTWSLGDHERRRAGMAEIDRRAQSYGLPPMRWPDPWPTDYLIAMRAATYAFTIGKGRQFTLQAFRSAFRHGRDMRIAANVLQAGERVGIDRDRLITATTDQLIKQALRGATEAAFQHGVFGVPTLAIEDELFWGDDRLQDAAAHLRRSSERSHNDPGNPVPPT